MPSEQDDWFTCPVCGEVVREDALACPHCGADDDTGWNPEAEEDHLDIPGFEDTPSVRPMKRGLTIAIILLMIGLLLLMVFNGGF